MRTPWIALCSLLCVACDQPSTLVGIRNQSSSYVYRAFWQAVSFSTPVAPEDSSVFEPTVAASDNTAYALLAPAWDPSLSSGPTVFLVLESQTGFSLHFDHTLQIPIDDSTFNGDCSSGHPLAQSDADFITQRVFSGVFAGRTYDAATCTTHPVGSP